MLQNRKLIWPAFLVAFSLVVIPPVDAALQAFPFRFGDPTWRFGFFGLVSNAMMIPMIGLLIAFIAAAIFEFPTFQRVLGVVCGVIAACTAAALIMFALDVLQLHGHVKPGPYQRAFAIASGSATIKALIAMITLIGFARAAFAPRKRPQKAAAKGNIAIDDSSATRAAATGRDRLGV